MNGLLNRIKLDSFEGAEGAYAILWADPAALNRSLPNYLLATVVAASFASRPSFSDWGAISGWTK